MIVIKKISTKKLSIKC